MEQPGSAKFLSRCFRQKSPVLPVRLVTLLTCQSDGVEKRWALAHWLRRRDFDGAIPDIPLHPAIMSMVLTQQQQRSLLGLRRETYTEVILKRDLSL